MKSAKEWAETLRDCRPGALWTLVEDIRAEQRTAIAAELRDKATQCDKRSRESHDDHYIRAEAYENAADIVEKFGVKP